MDEIEVERKKDVNAILLMMGVLSEKLRELSRIMIRIDEKASLLLECLKMANITVKNNIEELNQENEKI